MKIIYRIPTYGTNGFRNWSCSEPLEYPLEYDEIYVRIIYISRIYALKLLPLAAAHFHFPSCAASLLNACSTQVCLA